MKKRVLAILLCLSVLLMACACVAETMEPPAVSETESQAPAPQFTLSEVNAESSKTQEPAAPSEIEPQGTISMEESDIELEPIQPIEPIQTIVPVEKETTLEKIFSFDIGVDGVLEYNFIFYDDPSVANIASPGLIFTDGNGSFYHADDSQLIRLNDGVCLPKRLPDAVEDIEICGNSLYILDADAVIYQYDISDGFENATLLKKTDAFKNEGSPGRLYSLGVGEPVYYSASGDMYTLSKMKYYPYDHDGKTSENVLQNAESGILSVTECVDVYRYFQGISNTTFMLAECQNDSRNSIYTTFDPNGNILSRFMLAINTGVRTKCERAFDWYGEVYTVKSYVSFCASLGNHTFENLLRTQVFCDANGRAYFAAYYLDRCDIYSINQGYSNIQFPVDEEL
ncbi:MAG: hypothetical protein E7651_02015 [Ruminococcaceae bacterium]|nr:hypothetical protein [Oscillospiraceae bacterium]